MRSIRSCALVGVIRVKAGLRWTMRPIMHAIAHIVLRGRIFETCMRSVLFIDATHDETSIEGMLTYNVVSFDDMLLKCTYSAYTRSMSCRSRAEFSRSSLRIPWLTRLAIRPAGLMRSLVRAYVRGCTPTKTPSLDGSASTAR